MAPSSIEQMRMIYKHLGNDNVKRIVLTGEPGVGKTWMARKLSDHAMKEGKFDLTLWIFLNRKYDQTDLLESIACQLSLLSASDEWEVEDENKEENGKEQLEQKQDLKSKITDAIEGKRILLVFDDEGNQMMDSEIESNLNNLLLLDQRGSCKILITRANCRNSPVPIGKLINLEPLSEEESLALLGNMVGTKFFELPGIQDLAKYFVEDSRKLPAEIVIIAKALRYFGKDELGRLKLENAKEEALLHSRNVATIKLLSNGYEPLPSTILIDSCFLDSHFLSKRGAFHYNELISYWILEGYLDHFDCVADAFERGHHVLMELIDCGLVKELEAGYVIMNKAIFDLDAHDKCRFVKTRHLGLATVLDIDLGRTNQVDGVIKTVYAGREREKISTLLYATDHLDRDIPDDFFQCWKDLGVLAIFNPTIVRLDLPLLEMHNLRLLVLRGCDFLESINIQKVKGSAATPMSDANTDFSQLEGSSVPEMSNYELEFGKLRVLEISGPSSLTAIPDYLFIYMPKLQSLNLSSLRIDALPSSFYNLSELVCLILRGCSCLKELGSLKSFTKLELLDLSGATSFEQFHDRSLKSNQELRTLNLSQSKIMRLPLINSLGKLTHLFLTNCTELYRLRKIGSLSSLQILDLSGSTNFEEFHDPSFEKLSSLKLINISQTSVDKLPVDISNPCYLYLNGCLKLKELLYIESMKDLQVLDLSGSRYLEEIEEQFFCHLTRLRVLNLSETNLKSLPSLSNLRNLRSLLMSHCLSLTKLGELKSMEKLEVLDLSASNAFTDFEDESFEPLHRLQKLGLSGTKVTRLPSLSHQSVLRHLLLKGCTNLQVLPSLRSLSKLEELNLSGVRSIGNVGADFLEHMPNLHILDLSETQIQKLPSLSALKDLTYLSLRGCQLINEVPGLPMLTKLEVLDLSGTAVEDLPPLDNFGNLRRLFLKDCSRFRKFDYLEMLKILEASIAELPYNISKLTHLQQLELPGAKIDEVDAKSTKYTSEDLNRCNWSISSWPEEALNNNSDKLGLTFQSVHLLQLLEKNPHVWQSNFKQFHFLVHPTDAQTNLGDKLFYINELLMRDTYLLSQNRKRERSLEMRGFNSFPKCLELVLAHAECVFLIDNPFVRHLSDICANNIKQMKVCWIQRCCNMESVLHEDDVKAEIGDNLEILWVSDVVSMKSICDSNLQGNSFGNLKCLYLEYCSQLSHVCFSAEHLKNLEVLQIKYCHNMRTLFEDESSDTLLPKLQTLQLWALPKLRNIDCAVPTLNTLTIGECPLLVNVFSSSQLPGNLEILQIKFCDGLETVFCGSGLEMTKLHQLHLWDLPELKSVGAHLPSLQDRVVRQCPKLL